MSWSSSNNDLPVTITSNPPLPETFYVQSQLPSTATYPAVSEPPKTRPRTVPKCLQKTWEVLAWSILLFTVGYAAYRINEGLHSYAVYKSQLDASVLNIAQSVSSLVDSMTNSSSNRREQPTACDHPTSLASVLCVLERLKAENPDQRCLRKFLDDYKLRVADVKQHDFLLQHGNLVQFQVTATDCTRQIEAFERVVAEDGWKYTFLAHGNIEENKCTGSFGCYGTYFITE
jgi:hypothetical protein